jgi:hypothetical protein
MESLVDVLAAEEDVSAGGKNMDPCDEHDQRDLPPLVA